MIMEIQEPTPNTVFVKWLLQNYLSTIKYKSAEGSN
jgi:hypothetical protein